MVAVGMPPYHSTRMLGKGGPPISQFGIAGGCENPLGAQVLCIGFLKLPILGT